MLPRRNCLTVPIETRLFVKTSLLWLCGAFVLGAGMLAFKALGIAVPFYLSIVHAHMAFVGWLVNLVIGIALWFLPVNRQKFPENRGRYPVSAVRLTYAMLNLGLALRLIFEPILDTRGPGALASGALLASAALQVAAIGLFAAIAWQRVRQV
jgi:nitric oxide reductase large subunit